MNPLRLSPLALLVALLLPPSVPAAAPVLTYLYPAGAQRGTSVEVTAGGTFERWPVQTWTSLHGVEVKPAKDSGKLTIAVAADVVPGVCWIRLYDEQGASGLRPFLVGTLPEVLEREPNDEPAKAQVLEGSALIVNGRLGKFGDVDVFALDLGKGQTLVASMEANYTLKSPMDTVLQVLSADGFVLEQNDDHRGIDPQVVFTAPRAGRYLIRTFAFPATPDAGIGLAGGEAFVYRLTLTTAGFAEYAYPLAVTRAASAEVEVIGWNLPPFARRLPVRMRPGSDEGTVFHAQMANPVHVRVEPHPAILEKEPNSRQQPQHVDVPVTVSGRIGRPGEVDVYEFTLKKGQKLPVIIEARTLESPLDPVLRLTDRAGKILMQAQAVHLGADPELAIAAAADTTYRIEVSDLHGDGGPRFVYRLRLALAEPDFALTVAADRFALIPGKPLEVAVTIERRHGFAAEVEVAALDLPPGITAKTVKVASGAKSVSLRLTGDGPPVSGTFRILGRTQGGAERTRIAVAAIAEMGVSTENLWLTMSKTATVPKQPTR